MKESPKEIGFFILSDEIVGVCAMTHYEIFANIQ
jgi:hypothetical protein